MTVSTFTQPNYSSDLGTTYTTNIDGAINVLAQIGQDFAPHQAATANLTVLIDAGKIIKADGTLVSQAQQTATFVAPSANPRIDRIVIDMLTGAYSIIAGTEAASPTAPAITAGKLPCAQVSLSVGITQITNALITDERTAYVSLSAAYTATGTDTYTATGLVSETGFDYRVTFTNANTSTTPTLNGTTIVKEGNAALVAGDIPDGHATILRKTASNFVLLNPTKRFATFTTAGAHTWTCPSGVHRVHAIIIGGGGGGGAGGPMTTGNGGSGGGGGGSVMLDYETTPATEYSFTVGAGGAGGASEGASGSAGSQTTAFSMVCGGGGGGGGNGGSAGTGGTVATDYVASAFSGRAGSTGGSITGGQGGYACSRTHGKGGTGGDEGGNVGAAGAAGAVIISW